MVIPEGCLERDHQGRWLTWGRIASRGREVFLSVRVGRWRYLLAWSRHYGYLRRARWQARGLIEVEDNLWRQADD